MRDAMDPDLLQDFLTEAAELVEQLDADLVKLEAEAEAEARERLNSVFRALHTIKGAASFLGLGSVTSFSHVAEDALNRLRKGEADVTADVMDALLQSVDVLRAMIDAIGDGREADAAPDSLLEALRAVGGGSSEGHDQAEAPAAAPTSPDAQPPADDGATATRPLELPSQKRELVSFMVEDLRETAAEIRSCAETALDPAARNEAATRLAELADSLEKVATFFDLDELDRWGGLFRQAADALPGMNDQTLGDALTGIAALTERIDEQAASLEGGLVRAWRDNPALVLLQRALGHEEDEPTAPAAADDAPTPEPEAVTQTTPAEDQESAASAANRPVAAEQTIRVEVGRLEALLNLVGQLVLTKNRLLATGRQLEHCGLPQETRERVAGVSEELDRLTGELQVSVMRTRMQPLAKLFDRYPRVIRDMARATGKKLALEVVGKETEVDKSVLELLGDPLIHILRNSADHGVEKPEDRLKLGKPETGTIRLSAAHAGSHVRVEIQDDGKGLDREVLLRKAVEKGLVSAEHGATLSDREVFQFIFAAGFSTADKVSDLSGRGVGMDVVRTNVSRMNGTINVNSVKGRGTTIEILIPLTVAIMPAMVVGVGDTLYCVPLQTIVEIVRPEEGRVHTIRGQMAMRLRDTVLPLVDLRERLSTGDAGSLARFAVVVSVGDQRAGLMVDRLIGQQEIVIKPLDDAYAQGGPFSGATIRENGEVSLILDVVQLVRKAAATSENSVEHACIAA